MNKKHKILAACQDPGGCAAILPVIDRLRSDGHEVAVYASLYGAEILSRKGQEIHKIDRSEFGQVGKVLEKEIPAVVLLGTSHGYSLEDVFVEECRKRSIPSIAVYDSWTNYTYAFSDPENRQDLRYLPDRVCVQHEYIKTRMMEEGVPEERIIITGNPYFDDLLVSPEKSFNKLKSDILKRSGLPAGTLILTYISSRIDKSYGGSQGAPAGLGYDQFAALDLLLKAAEKDLIAKRVLLIIRPHPKETASEYLKYCIDNGKLKVMIDEKSEAHDLLMLSDVIAGTISMLLVEGYLLRKKVMSIQPGDGWREDPFILSRLGIIKALRGIDQVSSELAAFINEPMPAKKQDPAIEFISTKGNTSRVIESIYQLCASEKVKSSV